MTGKGKKPMLDGVAVVRDQGSGLMVSAHMNDVGTPERWTKNGGVDVGRHFIWGESQSVSYRTGARAVAESLFDRMVQLGIITDPTPPTGQDSVDEAYHRLEALRRRVSAASWLMSVYARTGLSPSVTGKYQVSTSRSDDDISDEEADARAFFNTMWRFISRRHADALFSVVCLQELPRGLTDGTLRRALDELAKWREIV